MTPKPKAPTTAETLKDIQQNRIAYGADERARFVEHVCGLMLNDRFGPGASDDMLEIEDHVAEDARLSFVDHGVTEFRSYEFATTAKLGRIGIAGLSLVRTGSDSDRVTAPFLQLVGHLKLTNAPPTGPPFFGTHVRTGSRSDSVTSPPLQLLGHLKFQNAPPSGPPVLGRNRGSVPPAVAGGAFTTRHVLLWDASSMSVART